ncbi:lantibiotic dehydratase [Streptomyces lydicus]|uniref:lantibiotic dehydratase n=1 Tax=Streptomyces lydicus TaxID=47763 RepID=UPI0037A622DA
MGRGGEAWLRRRIDRLASDPALRAAVRLASPRLADEIAKVRSGEPLRLKTLRRIAVTLAKYHLRMRHRPTPFGLFAGVALADFGDGPSLTIGSHHRTVSRPDAAWLQKVVEQLLEVPEVLVRTRLCANNLRTERDSRIILLDRHETAGQRQVEPSIRSTTVVRTVLETATAPLAWEELAAEVTKRFPQAPTDTVRRCLTQLVRGGFLLTDLEPPSDCPDALGHILDRLRGLDHPVVAALRGIQEALKDLDAVPPSGREKALVTVSGHMEEVHGAEHTIQAILTLDAALTLPMEVAREAERVASVLWELSRPAPGAHMLREYQLRFLERYGTDTAVPVLELLDPVRGLGLPDHHRQHTATGAEPAETEAAARWDRALGELLPTAVGTGVREVELDEQTITKLINLRARDAEAPPSLELGAELTAESWEALCIGDFQLVLGATSNSPTAGATFGRFSSSLGAQAHQMIGNVARRGQHTDVHDSEIPACVSYRPTTPRSGNISTVPQWLPHRIPLGVGPAAADTTDLPAESLAVCADLDRLHLIDTVSGKRVRALSYSMLQPASGHIPSIARFLLELAAPDRYPLWDWGAWNAAPALPRVRYGRTVLAPARWRPSRDLLAAAAETRQEPKGPSWEEHVAAWRKRWELPQHVLVAKDDSRIPLDLEDPLHLLVFRDELRRSPRLLVTEQPPGASGSSWFRSTQGSHPCEVVIPLVRKAATPAPAPLRRPAPAAGGRPTLHLPGGEWLYAKVYIPEALHHRVLTRFLGQLTNPSLLRECRVDSWFFLRYADPDPHLRLRFHGKEKSLWGSFLPALRSWMENLHEAGLASRLVLDAYEPEVNRYGGPHAIGKAEHVFHTDSLVVCDQLRATTNGPETQTVVESAALGTLAVLSPFAAADIILGALAAPHVLERRAEVSRASKEALAARLTPQGRPLAAGHAPHNDIWHVRAAALTEFSEALPQWRSQEGQLPTEALSLAHMHCNRLLGTNRSAETLALATAYEALATRLSRSRHGR